MSISITKIKNIPQKSHYVVLVDKILKYDDGYGREGRESYSTEEYLGYYAFSTEEDLKNWVIENKNAVFRVISAQPVAVSLSIRVDVKFD